MNVHNERDREAARRWRKARRELLILAALALGSLAITCIIIYKFPPSPGTVAPASRQAASAGVFFEKERK